jgi:opine dehydrogenase
MNITIIGAGNSGLAMAAHLSLEHHSVTLWNRTPATIEKLMETHIIYCEGVIHGEANIHLVTDNLERALENAEVILITTPTNSHKELAKQIALLVKKPALIVLNPGRTFGALEFKAIYEKYNQSIKQTIAETQTIIYTCRKMSEDAVNIIAMKVDVLISTFIADDNPSIIAQLPECIRQYFMPAKSMIQTSIGNVGMVLHCAPLLLNTGWTENAGRTYKYYYEGITPSVAQMIEKIDHERVMVSKRMGFEVETTENWLKRTYGVEGNGIYECIQDNENYKTIDAPASLNHRYIFEDIPCGLVPLEAIGHRLGLSMKHTSLIIDLAEALLGVDFRRIGRRADYFYDHGHGTDFGDELKRSLAC